MTRPPQLNHAERDKRDSALWDGSRISLVGPTEWHSIGHSAKDVPFPRVPPPAGAVRRPVAPIPKGDVSR
ncbi:hypothetical protein Cci01nite_65740 [Catellatospora citrea]|uniref:Uncharacterized protein n=1 Tax=Catellatospora citrea TaxID=53366 RepID=A0A8J3P4R0_9ACTN|nr:hypothetical protein Cci01nite_65740 [Catellatospora citrea]